MEEQLARVVAQVRSKYYGKYRGFVVDNQDPERRGRLRLRVPSVLGAAESGWALPALPFGGLDQTGLFFVPDVEAQVWVEFEEGDLSGPIWTGTFWQTSEHTPQEAAHEKPTTRLIRTPSGHVLQFDDEADAERVRLVHRSGSKLEVDPAGIVALSDSGGAAVRLDPDAGTVVVEDAHGNSLTMSSQGTTVEDAHGNRIEMAGSGVTVQGQQVVLKGSQVMLGGQGGEPVIKGQSFLTFFASHMHPSPAGPTGPPVPQGEMSTLSATVKTT